MVWARRMADAGARLRAELEQNTEQLAALEADRARIVAASVESNADDEHDPEGSTIAFEREQLASLLEQLQHTRDDLEHALAAIDDGTYGVCEVCGGRIAPERLEARPRA